ncbi:MAG: hypothetical protein GWN64_12835 [Candidatus Thorarchaeota archaeon]|nr:hypothetical protein [Candidatus Thorarchaeota archaeon]
MLKEYVSRIEEACGEGRDFIVILKYSKRKEAIKRILAKCKVEHTLSRVMTKGKYRDKDLSVFVTGKLILKGLKGRKEAEEILEELLT